MSSTDHVAAPLEANSKLMQKVAPFVSLLNGLSDRRVLWQVAHGKKDYVDALGDLIPAGVEHYRKGEPSQQCDEVRLSAVSMDKFISVLFTHNRDGVLLAKRVNEERLEEMRRAMKG